MLTSVGRSIVAHRPCVHTRSGGNDSRGIVVNALIDDCRRGGSIARVDSPYNSVVQFIGVQVATYPHPDAISAVGVARTTGQTHRAGGKVGIRVPRTKVLVHRKGLDSTIVNAIIYIDGRGCRVSVVAVTSIGHDDLNRDRRVGTAVVLIRGNKADRFEVHAKRGHLVSTQARSHGITHRAEQVIGHFGDRRTYVTQQSRERTKVHTPRVGEAGVASH